MLNDSNKRGKVASRKKKSKWRGVITEGKNYFQVLRISFEFQDYFKTFIFSFIF